jgi:hypothetical protein
VTSRPSMMFGQVRAVMVTGSVLVIIVMTVPLLVGCQGCRG